MSVDTINSDRAGHPAPHRHRSGIGAMIFGLVGGPVAWGIALTFNYAVASNACYTGFTWPTTLHFDAGAIRSMLIGADIAVVLVAAGAALLSYRNWERTRREAEGGPDQLLETGEGRTRFMSLCGMITSVGFAVAAAFTLVGAVALPLC